MKKSIWQKNHISKNISGLTRKELEVDVAIIGGGICGITTAALLKDSGLKIAVLEGDAVAAANTGKSTGNLYITTDTPLQELIKKYDGKTVREVLDARGEALKLIEKTIQKFQISCSFKKVPWIYFSATPEMDSSMEEEYKVAQELDLNVQWLDKHSPELQTFKGRCGVKIPNQAQFNPYSYVNELAEKIYGEDIQIFENARVNKIKKDEDGFILSSGKSIIYAKKIIHATHTPLEFSPLQTMVAPYREYGLARKLKIDFPDGIYWGLYEKGNVSSIRKHRLDRQDYIITVGAPHKVGQGSGEESLAKLHHTLDMLNLDEKDGEHIEWSGQHFRSSDHLPFIGEGFDRDVFVCTGFFNRWTDLRHTLRHDL